MASVSIHVDFSIGTDTGTGSVGDPYGNLYYAMITERDTSNQLTSGDLVTNDEEAFFIVKGGTGGAVTTALPLGTGWTTNATHRIWITADSAEWASGVFDTSKAYIDWQSSGSLAYTTRDLHFLGVQIDMSSNSSSQTALNSASGGGGYRAIEMCHIRKSGTGGSSNVGINIGTDSTLYESNNIFSGLNTAVQNARNAGNFYHYNSTYSNCGIGYNRTGTAEPILKNNLFTGCTTDASGTFGAGTDYNATDNASIGYTVTGGGNDNDRPDQTFTFSSGLTLSSTDTGARGYGVDLSADTDYPISTDITNTTRSGSWDIGASQSVATGDQSNLTSASLQVSTNGLTVDATENVISNVTQAALSVSGNTLSTTTSENDSSSVTQDTLTYQPGSIQTDVSDYNLSQLTSATLSFSSNTLSSVTRSIDSITGTIAPNESITINCSGLDTAPTTQTVTFGGEALTVTDWNSGNPICTIPSTIALKWGVTTYTLSVTDDSGTVTLDDQTLSSRSGWGYTNYTGPAPGASEEGFVKAALDDLSITMEIDADQAQYETSAGAIDGDVTVGSDLVVTVIPPSTKTGAYAIWDNNVSSRSSESTFTFAEQPTLTGPALTSTGATTMDLAVTTDVDTGTLYWYISTSVTPPSATDLKAGTGADAFGSIVVIVAGEQTDNATGLSPGTTYYLHALHTNTVDSDIVTSLGVSTDAADEICNVSSIATTLAPQSLQADVTQDNLASLTSVPLQAASNALSSESTEHNTSTVAQASLSISSNSISAEASENNFSDAAQGSLSLQGSAPQVTSTENNQALMSSVALSVSGNSLTTESTADSICNVAQATFSFAAATLTSNNTEDNTSSVSSASTVFSAGSLNSIFTENNVTGIVQSSLVVNVGSLQSIVGESHVSDVPSMQISFTGNELQTVTGNDNISSLPLGSVYLASNVPSTDTTEHHVSNISATTLDILSSNLQTYVEESHTSIVYSASFTFNENQIQSVTGADNLSNLGNSVVSFEASTLASSTTENNISGIQSTSLISQSNVPSIITTEQHWANLLSVDTFLSANTLQTIVGDIHDCTLTSASVIFSSNALTTITFPTGDIVELEFTLPIYGTVQ